MTSDDLFDHFVDLAHQERSGPRFFERWQQEWNWEFLPNCPRFLRLIKSDVLTDWSWDADLRRRISKLHDLATAVGPTLLERVLLPVAHRRDPEVIRAFVKNYFPYATRLIKLLDNADWPGTIDAGSPILEQEQRYGQLLFEMSEALQADSGPRWAVGALIRIARQRALIGSARALKSTFNIAFAFTDLPGLPDLFRPAFIIPMTLGPRRRQKNWTFAHQQVFHEDFLAAVESVRGGLREMNLLEIQHDWNFLKTGMLRGSSGSMATALALYLAQWNTDARLPDIYTLPPWLLISATLDPQGHAVGGTAGEVASLVAKSQAAIEEGIRVLVTVPPTDPPLDESHLQAHDLSLLPLNPIADGMQQVAERLYERGLLWPTTHYAERHPEVRNLTNHPDDIEAWNATRKCYDEVFPADERIDLEDLHESKSAVLLVMLDKSEDDAREEFEVIGMALVSGTPAQAWMFGSYLWIKDDFRSTHLLYFQSEIMAACRDKVGDHFKGIIFEVDEPQPASLALARTVDFDEQVLNHVRWPEINCVVRQVRRLYLYMKHPYHPCYTIVDATGRPLQYRQPSMSTDDAELCRDHEVPMYLFVLFADEKLRADNLKNEGRDDARTALEYVFETFWPTQSAASRTCSPTLWPKYFADMSRDLRSRISECRVVNLDQRDLSEDVRAIKQKILKHSAFVKENFPL